MDGLKNGCRWNGPPSHLVARLFWSPRNLVPEKFVLPLKIDVQLFSWGPIPWDQISQVPKWGRGPFQLKPKERLRVGCLFVFFKRRSQFSASWGRNIYNKAVGPVLYTVGLYKPHFGLGILLFGLREVRGENQFEYFLATFEGAFFNISIFLM